MGFVKGGTWSLDYSSCEGAVLVVGCSDSVLRISLVLQFSSTLSQCQHLIISAQLVLAPLTKPNSSNTKPPAVCHEL